MAKFKIGGWKDRRGGAQGTPQVKIDGWNAELEILTAYYRSGSQEDNPDVVCVKANAIDESWRQTEYIPASELTTKKLQQLFPRLYYHGRGKTDIGGIVRSQLYQGLDNGTVRKGFLFDELGSNTLPDRKTVFIRGDEIIGDIDRPYFLTEDTNRYHLLGEKNSVGNLISLLLTAPVQVLLMLAFEVFIQKNRPLWIGGRDEFGMPYDMGGDHGGLSFAEFGCFITCLPLLFILITRIRTLPKNEIGPVVLLLSTFLVAFIITSIWGDNEINSIAQGNFQGHSLWHLLTAIGTFVACFWVDTRTTNQNREKEIEEAVQAALEAKEKELAAAAAK